MVSQGRKKGRSALASWRQDQGHLGRKLWCLRSPQGHLEGAGPEANMGTAPWSHRLYVGRHKAKGEPEGPFKSRGQARPSLLPDSKGSSVPLTTLKFLSPTNLETRLIWQEALLLQSGGDESLAFLRPEEKAHQDRKCLRTSKISGENRVDSPLTMARVFLLAFSGPIDLPSTIRVFSVIC